MAALGGKADMVSDPIYGYTPKSWFAGGPGRQPFTQKLIGNLEYGNLPLRFRPRRGAHSPMHRGAWYIGRA